MSQLLFFNVFNGLIIGAFYALMALGLSLILNLSGVINFAHGGFLAIGAYIAYMLIPYIGFWGALVLAPILTAVIGLAVERVLIRRLYGRDPLYSLLLTFGLAFIIEDGTRVIWGAQGLQYQIPSFLQSPLSNELFFLTGYRVFMVGMVAIIVLRLFLLLNHTRLGLRIRAGTLDLETVSSRRQCAHPAQSQFRTRHLHGRSRRRAGRRHARPAADHRRFADHAEFHFHHHRRSRQSAGHFARRADDRRRLRHHHGVPAGGE